MFTITLILIGALLFWNINPEILLFALGKRWVKIWAIMVTGSALGIATMVFQTITGNRILSPGILGLDTLYLMLNVVLIFTLGAYTKLVTDPYINFLLSTLLMTVFSTVLYIRIFVKIKSLYKVILIGFVMGTLFSSIVGMLQTIMNPDAYNVILDKLFASYNFVNEELLLLSSIILVSLTMVMIKKRHLLDVISLGHDRATNLGVNVHDELKWILILIFIMISISTALVGPITFLGFFAANISRNLLPTYKHHILIPGAALSAVATLVIGQILVERIFAFGLPIGVLISLWGGSYFIYLILRGKK